MSTTGQTVYEQLQEFLNECVRLGRLNKIFDKGVFVLEDGVYRNQGRIPMFSFHDLFSKDSGLMEFIWPTTEYTYVNEYGKICNHHKSNKSHYHKMSMMTADMKIKHFLSNAKLLTKSE